VNLFIELLNLINEILAATIVVLAASILLYNVTRNLHNRVARTSAILLGCVTMTYLADVFVALGPDLATYENVLRLQWIGIAFMPAASFHLSDSLLATTGLPSRGRRRFVVRLMYLISAAFLIGATLTDTLISPVTVRSALAEETFVISLRSGFLFPIYALYFVIAVVTAIINVQRARQRCLTRATARRMGYLQIAMITPALGIFPFSVLLGVGAEFSLIGLILVNAGNFVVVLMLLFLAYPLSFFGSDIPDRVVKTELLRFILRGPATGLLALGTYVFTNATSRILGLQGQEFTPFAIVAVILLWQWLIALRLPWLERRLVYGNEDYDQIDKLANLSERLLTRTDLLQLIDALLAASCDYLRTDTAFLAAITNKGIEIVRGVGLAPANIPAGKNGETLLQALADDQHPDNTPIIWQHYWVVPLLEQDTSNGSGSHQIGILGIKARSADIDLTEDERITLDGFAQRAAQALEDMKLQGEIFAALEGLLPQISTTRRNTDAIEYRPGRQGTPTMTPPLPDREQFVEQVRAALRQLWGGPGLTQSKLLELHIVRAAMTTNDGSASKALRAVLVDAIEQLRPVGERKPMSPEWTLYSILESRFLKGQSVREVANRLAFSEPDFYRKQRLAVETVAEILWQMETAAHETPIVR
jgi:hypothetical protein